MPDKFLVLKREVYIVPVEVVANSFQNAVDLVRNGFGKEEKSFTWEGDLCTSTWNVGRKGDNIFYSKTKESSDEVDFREDYEEENLDNWSEEDDF